MNQLPKSCLGLLATLGATVVALLAGCSSTPAPRPLPPIVKAPEPAPPPLVSIEPEPLDLITFRSEATTPRDYRRDAAKHLYGKNSHRIFKGKMPPLLYAVGVLQIEVDKKGQVAGTHWMRAPNHAPEVVAEIERTVRNAAPYPAPVLIGRVTYTDTWLWHKSGRFQLDTLTEGQM